MQLCQCAVANCDADVRPCFTATLQVDLSLLIDTMTPAIVFPSTFVQSTSLSGTRTMSPSFKLEVGDFARAFLVTDAALLRTFSEPFRKETCALEISLAYCYQIDLFLFLKQTMSHSHRHHHHSCPQVFFNPSSPSKSRLSSTFSFWCTLRTSQVSFRTFFKMHYSQFSVLVMSLLLMQQIIGNTDPILALFNSFRSTGS